MGLDSGKQARPGYHAFHLAQENLSAGLAFLAGVVEIGKGGLAGPWQVEWRCRLNDVLSQNFDYLFSASLAVYLDLWPRALVSVHAYSKVLSDGIGIESAPWVRGCTVKVILYFLPSTNDSADSLFLMGLRR